MKFLVTGGAGFIGSNLVEELVRRGDEVIVVDNLSTGSLENLEAVKDRITVVTEPCSKLLDLKIAGIDGIFHLGIPSSSPIYKNDHLLTATAVEDFIKALELAKRENCRMVYASSSSIYNGNPIPWKEDMTIKVTDFYTEARYAMERMAKLYNDLFGTKSIGLRFFSVYGPHERAKKQYANLVSQFLWEMKAGRQPVIYGDGEQTRDLTFVKDVVHACMLAMESDIGFDVFNIGKGKSYSLNELVNILNSVLGTSIDAKRIENPVKNYVADTLADTAKAERQLGFKATVSLKDGLNQIKDSD